MKWKRLLAVGCLLAAMVAVAGCESDYRALLGLGKEQAAPLVKVRIQFTNGSELITYVRQMGISPETTVYPGGNSDNPMYDAKGRQVGVFNYANVLYMQVVE